MANKKNGDSIIIKSSKLIIRCNHITRFQFSGSFYPESSIIVSSSPINQVAQVITKTHDCQEALHSRNLGPLRWPIGTRKLWFSLSRLVNRALLSPIDFRTQPRHLRYLRLFVLATSSKQLPLPLTLWRREATAGRLHAVSTNLYPLVPSSHSGDRWRCVAVAGSPRCRDRISSPIQFNLIAVRAFLRGICLV